MYQDVEERAEREKQKELAELEEAAARQGSFFERNSEQSPEIISSILREGQLATLGGPFNVGKSPVLQDITVHRVHGRKWCGHDIKKGPALAIDFETSGPSYRRNITNICRRLGVPLPIVPEELNVFLEHDSADEPATRKLLNVLGYDDPSARLKVIEDALKRKPESLIIIDPLELFFRVDTNKKVDVLKVDTELRLLLSRYPHASLILTFNLRKRDRKAVSKPDLLTDPRGWMEEISGSLDLMNRSDVRLGIDIHEDDIRVIGGLRRGEEMHPFLVQPVGDSPETLAGFELVPADNVDLVSALTARQLEFWKKLPDQFRFNEAVALGIPRKSLDRLLKRIETMGGPLVVVDGVCQKVKNGGNGVV